MKDLTPSSRCEQQEDQIKAKQKTLDNLQRQAKLHELDQQIADVQNNAG